MDSTGVCPICGKREDYRDIAPLPPLMRGDVVVKAYKESYIIKCQCRKIYGDSIDDAEKRWYNAIEQDKKRGVEF